MNAAQLLFVGVLCVAGEFPSVVCESGPTRVEGSWTIDGSERHLLAPEAPFFGEAIRLPKERDRESLRMPFFGSSPPASRPHGVFGDEPSDLRSYFGDRLEGMPATHAASPQMRDAGE